MSRVVHLPAREGRPAALLLNGQRQGRLPRGPIGESDVADLPSAHEIVQRFEGFLERRVDIHFVDDIEIDPIRGKFFQAGVAGLENVAAGEPRLSDSLSCTEAHLGRDDHILAPRTKKFAQVNFGFASRVTVRRIKKIDAGIESAVNHRFRRIEIHFSYRRKARIAAEGHRAESKARNDQAGIAKPCVVHGGSLRETNVLLG